MCSNSVLAVLPLLCRLLLRRTAGGGPDLLALLDIALDVAKAMLHVHHHHVVHADVKVRAEAGSVCTPMAHPESECRLALSESECCTSTTTTWCTRTSM